MKKVEYGKKFAVCIAVLMLASATLGSILTRTYFPQTGTIGATLEDPLEAWSEASYIVWKYNSTFYACRNMSTNMAEINSNKTYLEQQAIGNLTAGSGTVYMKEVSHNCNVTVPANVSVLENVDGVARRFINLANSHGSPYTVSVDSGYYFGQDSLLNYINSWSSTNASQIGQDAMANASLNGGGTVFWKRGNYSDMHLIVEATYDNLTLEGETGTIFSQNTNTQMILKLNGMPTDPLENVVVRGIRFIGSSSNHASAGSQVGIWLNNTRNSLIEDNVVEDIACDEGGTGDHSSSIELWFYNYNNTITKNTVRGGTWIGIACGGGSQFNIISENHVIGTYDNNIDLNGAGGYNTYYNQVIHNTLEAGSGTRTGEGIDMDTVSYNLVHGNIIVGNHTTGIGVGSSAGKSSYNNFEDNKIYCQGNPSPCAGIYCVSGADNNTFTGNSIYDTGYIGINIEACYYNSFTDMNFYGCVSPIYVHNGANWTTINNPHIYGKAYRGIEVTSTFFTFISGGIIADQTYGIYLNNCNYTSIGGGLVITNCVTRGIHEYGTDTAGQTFVDDVTILNCPDDHDLVGATDVIGDIFYIASAP